MPTNISQTHSGGAGRASHIAIGSLAASDFVTACKNDSGILQLIGWRIEPRSSEIVRLGDTSQERVGEVDEVAMATLGSMVVTAVRDGDGRLLLISWSARSLDSISRLGDSEHTNTGHASLIAIAALTSSVVVTACRASDGDLLLIAWRIDADGSITRLAGEARAGLVSAVSITTLGAPFGRTVLTAVRNGKGNLQCIAWGVAEDGSSIVRGGPSGEAGAIREVAVVAAPPVDGFPTFQFITAVVNGAGNLQVIAWSFDGDGAIVRRGSSEAGTARHISIAGVGRNSTYVAAMRRGSGDRQLIAYNIPDTGNVTRTGDFSENAGGNSNIRETSIIEGSSRQAVTAMRGSAFLRVYAWDVDDRPDVF
jgi:hypothetical protein